MIRSAFGVLAIFVLLAQTACLGTVVEANAPSGTNFGTTRAHIIGMSAYVDASQCGQGISSTTTFVPLWGVAVGILTFGIIVPMNTVYTCR